MIKDFARTKEGGSVVTFAIVAVVLVVLVVGGIYTVQKSSQDQPKASPSPSVAKSSSPTSTPTKSPQSVQPQAPSQSPQSKPSTKNIPQAGTTPLPTTGPEDTMAQALMMATLVGVSVAYTQSYRTRRQMVRLSVLNR